MASGTEILVGTVIQPPDWNPITQMWEFQAPAVQIKVPETFLREGEITQNGKRHRNPG
jgi:hypothetical protein